MIVDAIIQGCFQLCYYSLCLWEILNVQLKKLKHICIFLEFYILGSKGGSFTPPLPRALSNTFLKMSNRDGSKSPTVKFISVLIKVKTVLIHQSINHDV